MGTLSGCWAQRGQAMQQADAVLIAFPHAQNASAAHLDAGSADVLQRLQPLLIHPRGDDAAVELGRGIKVVVVGGEPGLLELGRPARR